jgi:hypothetical protein
MSLSARNCRRIVLRMPGRISRRIGMLQVSAIVSAKDETIANLREHVADLRTALGKAESRADELQTELDRWRMARHWWQRRKLRRRVRSE